MRKVNYISLYTDFINDNNSLQNKTKIKLLKHINNQQELSVKKIIKINSIIKNDIASGKNNKKTQQLKAYDYDFVQQTLDYQKKYNLSNNNISIEFKLSRNTIAKWKKHFGN